MNMGPKIRQGEDREKSAVWCFAPTQKKNYISALSEHLRELREFAQITQDELAQIAGVSRQTYGSIELSKRMMSWNTYMSLIFYFDHNPLTHIIIRTKKLLPAALDGTRAYQLK